MAITPSIEYMLESAFVTVLGNSSAMSGCTIRRWADATNEITYPICLVHCNGSGEPEFSLNRGYDEAFLEIQLRTYKKSDLTSEVCNGYLAAARAVFRGASLISSLESAQSGIDVYSVIQEGKSAVVDDDKLHIRTLTLKVYATTVYLPVSDSYSLDFSNEFNSQYIPVL